MARHKGSATGDARLRTAAVVAVSVGAHAALLGYMASRSFELRTLPTVISDSFPVGRAYPVWLERRPLLKGEPVRTRSPRTADRRERGPNASGREGSGAPPGYAAAPVVPFAPAVREATPPGSGSRTGLAPGPGPDPEVGARFARALRARGVGCSWPVRSATPADQTDCGAALVERAAGAVAISATGDAARDARFARQGARRLSRYEAMRAPLSPSDDPPCDKAGPIADCELEIKVDVFSSTRGWLPNQRRSDE